MAVLTFCVLAVLGYRRFSGIRSKQYPLRYFKSYQRAEGVTYPEAAEAASRNFSNLFEMPVLFYAVIPLLVMTGMQDDFALAGLWAFVALRAVHSAVHLTTNHLVFRFLAYAVSCVCLFAVWVRLYQLI
jgi:hypothetical protein